MTIEEVKSLLRELSFPPGVISDQTALTLLALADRKPRAGLLAGHECLADGARIHDILNFVRDDFGRKVAEKPIAASSPEEVTGLITGAIDAA